MPRGTRTLRMLNKVMRALRNECAYEAMKRDVEAINGHEERLAVRCRAGLLAGRARHWKLFWCRALLDHARKIHAGKAVP